MYSLIAFQKTPRGKLWVNNERLDEYPDLDGAIAGLIRYLLLHKQEGHFIRIEPSQGKVVVFGDCGGSITQLQADGEHYKYYRTLGQFIVRQRIKARLSPRTPAPSVKNRIANAFLSGGTAEVLDTLKRRGRR